MVVLLAFWLLSAWTAWATPSFQINAEVDENLGVVTGEIRYEGGTLGGSLDWVDPLSKLPFPKDDRVTLRTFPGPPEAGKIGLWRTAQDVWRFYTVLPRRFGDVGTTRRRRLAGNGGWYPQPLVAGKMPIAHWDVSVKIPKGCLAALGTQVGEGRVTWSGQAERVSLAVLKRGVSTSIKANGVDIQLLTRGKPRKSAVKNIRANLEIIRPPGVELKGALVELPLRRRLARSGVGQAYLSDRAWRLTPGLH